MHIFGRDASGMAREEGDTCLVFQITEGMDPSYQWVTDIVARSPSCLFYFFYLSPVPSERIFLNYFPNSFLISVDLKCIYHVLSHTDREDIYFG